jgi:hypothetical protein
MWCDALHLLQTFVFLGDDANAPARPGCERLPNWSAATRTAAHRAWAVAHGLPLHAARLGQRAAVGFHGFDGRAGVAQTIGQPFAPAAAPDDQDLAAGKRARRGVEFGPERL